MADCRNQCSKTRHSILSAASLYRAAPHSGLFGRLPFVRPNVLQNEHQAFETHQRIQGIISSNLALLRSKILYHYGVYDERRHLASLLRSGIRFIHRRILYRIGLRPCLCGHHFLDYVLRKQYVNNQKAKL